MLKSSMYRSLLLLLISVTPICAQEPTAPPAPPDKGLSHGSGATVLEQPSTPPANAKNGYLLSPNPDAAVLPKPSVKLDPAHEYTLPELIDIAEREHQETRVAWQLARNAALAAGFAQSTYLPRVTANIVGGYQDSTGNVGTGRFTVSGTGSAAGTVSAISLEWLLFDFGGRANVVSAAKKLAQASNITFTGVHQKVIHGVCIAYYALLAARQRVRTNEQALANALELQNAAEARYSGGVGTLLESSQARQVRAQIQLATIQAEGMERDTYATLLAAMGLSPLEKIRIAPFEHRRLPPEILTPVEQVVKDALACRPDVLAAYAAEQASQASVKAAEALYRPKIFLAGTGAYASGQLGLTALPSIGDQLPTLNISGNQWSSAVLVGLTIPVFDGKRREDVIQQAKNNTVKAAATLDRIRIDAIQEIVAAQNALRTSIAANQAAEVLQEAAKTTYDAALDSYKQGVVSITSVIEAETQLLQANLATDDAYNSALSAAATLAFSTGSLGASP
jgi:outer membrane protein